MATPFERRAAAELTASGRKLVGYAAVFDSPSEDLGGFREIVRPGAFTRTLQDARRDPLALVQHLPHLVLGRQSSGTLRLAADARGLRFEVDPPDTQAARDLMVSVARGDITGCSFAFTVPAGGDRWEPRGDTVLRELHDIDLHEITVTAQPAYTDTEVALRALAGLANVNHGLHLPRLRAARRWLETT